MTRHNLLIAVRNFRKDRSSFLINTIGLSVGIASVLMMWLWIEDELRVDKFHTYGERLVQVRKNSTDGEGTVMTFDYTPALMSKAMAEDFPEVLYGVSVIQRDKGIMAVGTKRFKAQHLFATSDFLKAFSFQLIDGDPDKVLTEKYGVVITDRMAIKLFGSERGVLGKAVRFEWRGRFDGDYFVTGVIEAPPPSSSLQFEAILSYDLYLEKTGDTKWYSNNALTFLVLNEGVDAAAFGKKITNYSREKFVKLHGKDGVKYEGDVFFYPFSEGYLHGTFENGVRTGGRIEYVQLFSFVAVCVILIACINFMNLSTARAAGRFKEVGIKKAIGAKRMQLMIQFVAESLLVTCVAFALAIMIVWLLVPSFSSMTGKMLQLRFNGDTFLTLSGIVLFTGLVAGSYPAIYLSGFKPAMALKGLLKTSVGESWIRRGLVVFQFSVSVVMLVLVVIVYSQLEFIQMRNLGYNKSNIVSFPSDAAIEDRSSAFLEEVRRTPGVISAAGMNGDLVGSHSGGGGIDWEGKDHGIQFAGFYVDHGFVDLLGLKMIDGTGLSLNPDSNRAQVIFNETAIRMMDLKDPVGKKVKMWGKERVIVGVIADFHYESLYEEVGPLFIASEQSTSKVLARIEAGKEQETISRLSDLYHQFNPGLPFEYHFLDQEFEILYAGEQRVSILSRYFAGIAIMICGLGLFGLAAFTADRKKKEISIRKVLGASELAIVGLLSGGFMTMVLLAIIIGLPIGCFIGIEWLQGFAYRIELQWWFFAVTGLLAILVAATTISVQTFRAARGIPVDALRSE